MPVIMKKNDFYMQINRDLELGEKQVSEKTPLDLSSIQTLAVIAFADDKFRKRIKIADLKNVKSISGLMTIIGIENFTD